MERGPFKFLLRAIMVVAAVAGLLVLLLSANKPDAASVVQRGDGVGLPDLPMTNVTSSALNRGIHTEPGTTITNVTLQERVIDKRAILEHATPELFELFEAYRQKGEHILDLMFTPEQEIGDRLPGGRNGQISPFKEDYRDWDWSVLPSSFQQIQEIAYLQGLRTVQGFEDEDDPILFPGNNHDLRRFTWEQNKPYSASGLQYPVLYEQTAKEFGFHPLQSETTIARPPRWIVINEVDEVPETLEVVKWCLSLRLPPGFNAYPRWVDRQTFPIGSHCHAALLGTANSYGLAMYYLTHKFRFRNWVLASVTIFSNGDVGRNGETPTLIWWVERGGNYGHSDARVRSVRDRNKQADMDWNARPDDNNPGVLEYPWPMKLVYSEDVEQMKGLKSSHTINKESRSTPIESSIRRLFSQEPNTMYIDIKRRSPLWLALMAITIAAVTPCPLFSTEGQRAATDESVARNGLFPEPQVQGNFSVDSVISRHSTIDGRGLVKRQMADPADDKTFYEYRCKGEKVLQWLLATEQQLIEELGSWAQVHTTRNDMYGPGGGWSTYAREFIEIESVDASILKLAGLTGISGIPQSQPLGLQNYKDG
ncbi:hypothetical protein M409DRAFT_20961 [Zasmidium cellare ATCC 36951]|uniref:Uncharacterized protein n=1 Tax=Zasmidium cellare ATCC 36951 TaxID=1080233 RepID=A0A6A6CNU4_ZASCE|nr:uncharacterized protein M409DRAFT_20961 [Zasmidium cellare ATCC 36951]KAF2168947.1 hypothetical protein M409DRAFT_20961 [Zasmidium cellare ATCC 36951]